MSLKGLPRWKGPWEGPPPKSSFIADINAYDIPSVVAAMIKALPQRCKAVSIRIDGGEAMREAAVMAAADRNIRIIWKGDFF